MHAHPQGRDSGSSTQVRAITGLLLGLAVGAVAALVTPRRPPRAGHDREPGPAPP